MMETTQPNGLVPSRVSFSSENAIRDAWIPSVRKLKSLDRDVIIISSAYDLKDLSGDITALKGERMRDGTKT